MAIISDLALEATYVVLDYYSCYHCKTHKTNNAFNKHGRAWQLVAVQLEDTFARLPGIPLNLGRRDALWFHRTNASQFPSPHNLATYKLQNRYIVSDCDRDVFGAAYSTMSCHVLYMPFSWMEEQSDLRIVAKGDEAERLMDAVETRGVSRARPWEGADWTGIEIAHESFSEIGIPPGRKKWRFWVPRRSGTSADTTEA